MSERSPSRRTVLKALGTAGVGLGTIGAVGTERALAADYDCETFSETDPVEVEFTGIDENSEELTYVDKTYAGGTTVEVDGPYAMERNAPKVKYYVMVSSLGVSYVTETGERQIDIPRRTVEIEYPDDSLAEWDFPDASEPDWISLQAPEEPDQYGLTDFAFDAAEETVKLGRDYIERTIGTIPALAVDTYDYATTVGDLYDKFNDATSDTRKKTYDWSFVNDDTREIVNTAMMFEVSDIPEYGAPEHTVTVTTDVQGRFDPVEQSFTFYLEGANCARSPYQ